MWIYISAYFSVHCKWGSWTRWERCTCRTGTGRGTQSRERDIARPAKRRGKPCTGPDSQRRSCGASDFCAPPPPSVSIPNAEYHSKKTFLVTCNGPCRQIRALIEFNGGDADLFANEGQHPITSGLSCLSSTCSMCRATSGSSSEETCSDMATQDGNR